MSRLDHYLVDHSIYESRNAAQNAIQEGRVLVNDKIINKKSFVLKESDVVRVLKDEVEFASRAAKKLQDALQSFQISLQNRNVVDIGASTGGFSEVCLYAGANYVYAIDVGKDQLLTRLKEDPRICCIEGYNCRYLERELFHHPIDFICMDVSFISITLIVDRLIEVFTHDFEAVFLIKPQFEVGKKYIGKNGIVKDKKVHIQLLEKFMKYFASRDIGVLHLKKSSVVGKDGNQEYVVHVKNHTPSSSIDCIRIVKE